MRTTEMVLFAYFLKTSKFIPACISIYILSLDWLDMVVELRVQFCREIVQDSFETFYGV